MGTISTNLGLQIPTVAADADTWGDQLNFSLNTIDAIFQTGGTAISLGDVTTDDLAYTGSLTGSTGIINIGSGQIYKDAGGKVGIGTTNGDVFGRGYTNALGVSSTGTSSIAVNAAAGNNAFFDIGTAGSYFGGIVADGVTGTLSFGTAGARALLLNTNGASRLTIDSAGNAGLGVTPSAFQANYSNLEIGAAGSCLFANNTDGNFGYTSNAVLTGGQFVYQRNANAVYHSVDNVTGQFVWYTAPSGTAGNPITFTQAMTLTNAGNLLVGTAIDAVVAGRTNVFINGSSTAFLTLRTGDVERAYFAAGATNGELSAVGYLNFNTAGAERARITAAGNLLVGATNDLGSNSIRTASSVNTVNGLFSDVTGFAGSFIGVNNSGSSFRGVVSGTVGFGTANNVPMSFATNNTERARITSGGYFKASNTGVYQNAAGVGHEFETNTGNALTAYNTDLGGGANVISAAGVGAFTGRLYVGVSNAAIVYQVNANGDVQNTNNSYGALSDQKLKENVTPATPKLDDLMGVEFVNFNFIGDDKKQFGVIAQQLETVFPALVSETPDVDEEGNETGETTKAVNYSVLALFACKALQEANAKIESLEARLNAAGL